MALDPSTELLLSDLPERFEVLSKLGRGGMATVFRVMDRQTQSEVALKVLHPHLRDDPLIVERFRREIAAVRRIESRFVVPIFDIIESPLALVMAYKPGLDLKRTLRRRGRLPMGEVLAIADQILDGLSAAHGRGILHRDVKPHNILMDDEGNAALTDFGLARVDDLIGVTTHTMALGTPEYMAPEMLDRALVDGRADLYGLGIVLYEASTGKLPYTASSPLELLRLHDSKAAPPPHTVESDIPEDFSGIVMKAIAKDPDDRFATADQMRRALRGEPGAHDPPLPGTHPCTHCQAPIPPGLTVCLECGHTTVHIARQSKRQWSVVIKKVRAKGLSSEDKDTLTFQQKHAIVDTLGRLGATVSQQEQKLDKHMRSPPFVAANHLTESDAALISAWLEEEGVPTKTMGPGAPRMFWNFWVRAGIPVWAGGLGITALVLMNNVDDPTQMTLIAVLAMAVFAAITFGTLRHVSRAISRFDGNRGAHPDSKAVSVRARATFESLTSPRLRQLARSILTRGLALQGEIKAREDIPDAHADEVEQVLMRAMAIVDKIAGLEAELAARTTAIIHEEIEVIKEKMSQEEDMDAVEALIVRKVALSDELAQQDARQAALSRCASKLLEVSSELTAFRTRIHTLDDMAEGESIAVLLEELDIEVEAREEVAAILS